jgi:glutathione S-transferase
VPYLDIDDHTKLPQSLSIARYLAREYNLVGKSNLDSAKADSVVDTWLVILIMFYFPQLNLILKF